MLWMESSECCDQWAHGCGLEQKEEAMHLSTSSESCFISSYADVISGQFLFNSFFTSMDSSEVNLGILELKFSQYD